MLCSQTYWTHPTQNNNSNTSTIGLGAAKGWGPLRLYHITLCILLCRSVDSDSTKPALADLITTPAPLCVDVKVLMSAQYHGVSIRSAVPVANKHQGRPHSDSTIAFYTRQQQQARVAAGQPLLSHSAVLL
jgi:hypothetical protein